MACYMYARTLFLGYVQGMNELLSPLMIVLQSEHQSFWCLVNVLQRMVCHYFAILSHYYIIMSIVMVHLAF